MIRFLLMSWLCWWFIVSQCSARDLRDGIIKNSIDSRSPKSADDRTRESPQNSLFVTSQATFVIPDTGNLEPREISSEGSPEEEKYRFGMIGKFAKKTCRFFGLSCTFLVYKTSDTASKTSTTFPKTLLCGLCVKNKSFPEYHAHQCQHVPQSNDSVVLPPAELTLPSTNSGLQNSDGMENASATATLSNQVEASPTVTEDNVLHQRSDSLNNSNDAHHQSLNDGSEKNHSQDICEEGGNHNNQSNVDQLSQERSGNNQDDHDKSSLINGSDKKESEGQNNVDQLSQEKSGNNQDDHDKASLVDDSDKKESEGQNNVDQLSQEKSGNNQDDHDKASLVDDSDKKESEGQNNVDQLSQEKSGNNQDDHDKASLVDGSDKKKGDGQSSADQLSYEGSGNNRDSHDKSSSVDDISDYKQSHPVPEAYENVHSNGSNVNQLSREESGNKRNNYDRSSSFSDKNEDTRGNFERKHSKRIPGTYDDVDDNESDVPASSGEMTPSNQDDRGKSPLVVHSDVAKNHNNVHPVDFYNEKENDKLTSPQHYNGNNVRQYSRVDSDSIKNLDTQAKYDNNNNQVNRSRSNLIDDNKRKNSDQRPAPRVRRKPESVSEDSSQSPRTGVEEQPDMVRTRSSGKPSLSRSDTRDSDSSPDHEHKTNMSKCGSGGCNVAGALFRVQMRERIVGDEMIKEYDVECCPYSCTGCGCFGGSSLLDDGGSLACCFPCCAGVFRFSCLADFVKSFFNRPKKNKEKKKEKEKEKK